jgi:NAD(P)-dependent dehydrogenase (short-subunit alcohol dehydrogenase family)
VATLRQDRWWIQPVVTGASAGVGRATARAFAALLLSSIRAAVPSGEPRSQATVEAVANELAREDDVYRFQGTSNCSERPRARLYFVDY